MWNKKNIIEIVLMGGLSTLLFVLNVRLCPFFFLFKIPCPGCGFTRAFIALLRLNFLESFQYNLMCIPICIFLATYIFLLILKKEQYVHNLTKKYRKQIIIICFVVMLVSWIKNINNPLLY